MSKSKNSDADVRKPVIDVVKKRRFGDRRDGRRVRSLSPMAQLIPYIMKERSDAQNLISESINTDRVDEYINEKRRSGLSGFSFMHVIIAAYIRSVAKYPGINRFVSGQRVYTRDGYVEICLSIKREMTLASPDTIIKITLPPDAVAEDVYHAMNDAILGYRDVKDSGFDRTAKLLNYIPGIIKRFAFAAIRFFDYLGWLPRALTRVSPFHCSMFITSMASLGIPPIYHHLYNLGNVPLFIAFGLRRREATIDRDGTATMHSFVDVKLVTDERICDGYYFATAFRYLKRFMRNPWLLDTAPDEVRRDID